MAGRHCAWCWEPDVGGKVCPSCGMQGRGEFLRTKWNIPAKQVNYHWEGLWWHIPKEYPCAFASPYGYAVFENLEEVKSSTFLKITKAVHTIAGTNLQKLPNFIPITLPKVEVVEIDESSTDGSVYIISNPPWPGWNKVGCSSEPKKRLKNYQTGDPKRGYLLEYSRLFTDKLDAESKAHDILESKGYERQGEWFQAPVSIISEIIDSV